MLKGCLKFFHDRNLYPLDQHHERVKQLFTGVLRNLHCVKSVKYGVVSGPYFPVFRMNAGKCEPETASHLDTSRSVTALDILKAFMKA